MGNIELIYEVSGSAPEPYVVSVYTEPFSMSCTCQAGVAGLPCRHRKEIAKGSDTGMVSGDKSKLDFIKNMAQAAGVEGLLKNYDASKKEKAASLKTVDAALSGYRQAREGLALGKVKTDKTVIKRREALEAAIDASIEKEKINIEALKAARVVFERPAYTPQQLAGEAAGRASGWQSKRLAEQAASQEGEAAGGEEAEIKSRKPLYSIEYTDSRGETTERKIEIIKFKENQFGLYIYAYCHFDKAVRQFRVDRINALVFEGKPVESPQKFFMDIYQNTEQRRL